MTAIAISGEQQLRRKYPLAAVLLLSVGITLLIWLGLESLRPAIPVYEYQLETKGVFGDFKELGVQESLQSLSMSRYQITMPDTEQPLAIAYIAYPEDKSPVLLQWNNLLAEPVLYETGNLTALLEMVPVLEKQTEGSMPVVGWWDTMRALSIVCKCQPYTTPHQTAPLLVPQPWLAKQDQVEAKERAFWQVGSQEERGLFLQYATALAMEAEAGVKHLREMAGENSTLLILNITDAYKLGSLLPDQLGIGYKDFPGTGDMHGMIQRVKDWLQTEGYKHYAVLRPSDELVRVYFLTEESDGGRLVSRLLPFNKQGPKGMEGIKLIAQQSGYWVYEIAPLPAS